MDTQSSDSHKRKIRVILRIISIPLTAAVAVLLHLLGFRDITAVLLIIDLAFSIADGWISGLLSGAVCVAFAAYNYSGKGHLFRFNYLNQQRFLIVVLFVVLIVLLGELYKRFMQESGKVSRIKASQEKQRLELMQMLPSGLGIFDFDGKTIQIVYLNDGYYEMLHDQRSSRGTNSFLNVHPDDRPAFMALLVDTFRNHSTYHLTCRLREGDGSYRWISINGSHVPLEGKTGVDRYYVAFFDNDEIVKTQEKLREEELSMEEAMDSSDSIFFTYYPRLHRYELRSHHNHLTDLPDSMDDLPDSFIRAVGLDAADQSSLRAQAQKINAGAKEGECVFHLQKDTGTVWYRLHISSLFRPDGSVDKALGYLTDITSLKEAENRLSNEKLRLESLEENSLAFFFFDVTTGKVIESSDAGILPVDVSAAEALSREAAEVDPRFFTRSGAAHQEILQAIQYIPNPQQRRRFEELFTISALQSLYESGQDEAELEYMRRVKKGLRWVLTRVKIMKDPHSGDILAFYSTDDIHEEKIRREVSSSLINQSFDSVSYLDLSTRTMYCSAIMPDLGRTDEQPEGDYQTFIDQGVAVYVYPDDREEAARALNLDHLKQELETQKSVSVVYRLVDALVPPGKPCRRVNTQVYYLDEMKQYIVFGRTDITALYEQEQRQKEALQESVRRAEKANASKTDFLSRMSHDIRTPLNGIIGMTALARDEHNSPAVTHYLEKIDESSHFLLGLVNDILDMSKVESGKMELHPEPYTYADFKKYIIAVIQPLCDKRHIHFEMKISREDLILVVDKLRLCQIFFNLLSNSVKYTPEGGNVWVDIHMDPIAAGKTNVFFSVRDNGIGMSPQFQEKLFQPFEQEYTDKNASRSGSGLGLSIVKSLVDLMGGTITVTSHTGQGSQFFVALPLQVTAPAASAPQAENMDFSLSGKKILVAEDNAINAEIIISLLRKKGAEVTAARDGREALALFNASPAFSLNYILMDVRMPVMDGLQAAREIRALERPDAQQIPIIAMTANAYDDDIRDCLDAGMNAHIAKPIDTALLFGTLEKFDKKN